MATVIGTLQDFGLDPLTDAPEIWFTPSGAAVAGTTLHVTKPVKVVPASDGTWSVDLAPTAGLIPAVWYSVSVQWLDSVGGYIGRDFPQWKLNVPVDGGDFSQMITGPELTGMVWIGPTPPSDPAAYTGWVNSNTGEYYEWEE